MVLVRGLPKESLTSLVLDAAAVWSIESELMAATVEQLDRLIRQTIAFNTKKGTRLPEPIRVTRPGAGEVKAKRQATAADIRALGASVQYVGAAGVS